MSGLGHFAMGFAARPLAPKVPLPILLAAGGVNDALYFLFTATGMEKPAVFTVDLSQGVRYLAAGSLPWSHGLLMSLVWSILAGALAYWFYRDRRSAGVVGMVVLSHWALDFLMHANLPLWFDGSPQVGLGLENTGPGFIFMTLLDLALLAGGIATYQLARKHASKLARA